MFCKKDILRNFTKFAGVRVSFLIKFIEKETLAHVFSCEFFEISKNTLFYRTPLVAVSGDRKEFQIRKNDKIYSILQLSKSSWKNQRF